MRRRLATLFLLFAVALVGAGWAAIVVARDVADRSRDMAMSSLAAISAEQEAHLFWDNPIQRLLYVAISTTGVRPGPGCPEYEVTAFTFFGRRIDRVFVDCEGVRR